MLREPKISVETALEMLGQYARMNGIPGEDLAAIFHVGMLAARQLAPAILRADKLMVQRFDRANPSATSEVTDASSASYGVPRQ